MAESAAALISALEITDSWLLKHNKTQHSWAKALPLVWEAIQELVLTSLPIVQHTQITKLPNETWFQLPKDYMDWVSVGIRVGDRWHPVGISERLMPYPNSECAGGQYDSEHDRKQYRREGEWKSWLNRDCTYQNADFFADDFFNEDYSDENSTSQQPQPLDNAAFYYNGYGALYPYNLWNYGLNSSGEPVQGVFSPIPRPDEVTINVQQGIIMCPDNFPANILYLVYVSGGSADTMSYVPIKAQAAIEAYVSWKYALNKRGNQAEAREFERLFNKQHYLMRARFNDLTESVIRRIVDRGYTRSGWASEGYGLGTGSASNPPANITYYNYQFIILTAAAGTTYVQSNDLIGAQLSFVIVSGVYKDSGFYLDYNMVIFTDGTSFTGGEKVIVYYA